MALAEKIFLTQTRRRREATKVVHTHASSQAAAPASHEVRETPIELDPNSKRRVFHEVDTVSSQRQWTASDAEASDRIGNRATNRSTNGDPRRQKRRAAQRCGTEHQTENCRENAHRQKLRRAVLLW